MFFLVLTISLTTSSVVATALPEGPCRMPSIASTAPGPLGTRLVGRPGAVDVVDMADGAVLHSEEVAGVPVVVGFLNDAEVAWSIGDRVHTPSASSPPLGSDVVALCRVSGANVLVTADGCVFEWGDHGVVVLDGRRCGGTELPPREGG